MPRFYERTEVSPNGDNDSQIQKFLNHDPYYTHHFEPEAEGVPSIPEVVGCVLLACVAAICWSLL